MALFEKYLKQMSNKKTLTIYCDGGSRGNPGEAAYGFVMSDERGEVYKEGKRIGIDTNNVAEYSAVVAAFKYLSLNRETQYEKLDFYLDSQLVVNQMNGLWKIKNENLRGLAYSAKVLERSLGIPTSYTAVRREKNKAADAMVNLALDHKI